MEIQEFYQIRVLSLVLFFKFLTSSMFFCVPRYFVCVKIFFKIHRNAKDKIFLANDCKHSKKNFFNILRHKNEPEVLPVSKITKEFGRLRLLSAVLDRLSKRVAGTLVELPKR